MKDDYVTKLDQIRIDAWNEAIEAALEICRNRDTFESILLFDRIRKLKK
jgi:hypothetical protein